MAARGTQRHADGSVRRTGFRFYGEVWPSAGDSELHTCLSYGADTYLDKTGTPCFGVMEGPPIAGGERRVSGQRHRTLSLLGVSSGRGLAGLCIHRER